MKRTLTLAAAAAALPLLLAACGSDDRTGTPTGSASDHNATDVTFAQGMIPHHAQAVEMSELLLTKPNIDPQVVDLAEQIKAAQAPEIDTMTGWLTEWDEDVPATAGVTGMQHDMSDMGSMEDMNEMGDGMMSAEDMAALQTATGDQAAQLFLTQMTEHHTGAITMARRENADGEYPDAVGLANTIVETQEAEITRMRQLLTGL